MHIFSRIVMIVLLLIAAGKEGFASHIVGGEVAYTFMGNTPTGKIYKISLNIYEDCLHGSQQAINEDNPAYFAVYDDNKGLLAFDSVTFISSVNVPPNYDIACITNAPEFCMLKKTFDITFTLPRDHRRFTVVYQRCCRNGDIGNIINPANTGATYYCEIPSDTIATTNNSAVFNNFPPQIICINTPLYYDNSATDPDGDSLSYMLCESYDAPNNLPNNVEPMSPPFDLVNYKHPPYSYYNPLNASPALAIDPVTGIITGTPLLTGRYLVTVCCNEWRHGVLINTIHREFQFVVTNCSKVVVADMPYYTDDPSIYMIDCHDYNVGFINTSRGGSTWKWDFGVPGLASDTSSQFQPAYTYPDTGVYHVKLVANPQTPCADSIEKLVKIYPTFFTNFEDTGLMCPGQQIGFIDRSVGTTSEVNSWAWSFGDGQLSNLQSPVHKYNAGGTYNVMLVSKNEKDCRDTMVQQVVVEIFKPFAGMDTTIVKGESVQFNASGGIEYEWTPPIYLRGFNASNPEGFFTDTGLYSYIVLVKSAYGCIGADTINIRVVDQAAFFLPTAFSPNGDGLNDIFRPLTIGYKAIRFFRVYNRFGEQIFYSENIKDGWDGTYNNKQADIGTYYYYIGYIDRYGKEGAVKGDVTLVR